MRVRLLAALVLTLCCARGAVVSADAGAGGAITPPSTDAGSTDAGQGDAGERSPPPIDGGPADAGSGTTDAGTDAGTVTTAACEPVGGWGAVDPADSDPTLSNDCDGVVPAALPEPRTVHQETGTHASCISSAGDGQGVVATGFFGSRDSQSSWFTALGPDGGAAYGIDGVGTRDGVARILPQEDGFLGLELYRPPISWRVIRLPEGTFPVAEDVRLELLPDPTGGALVVELPRNYKQWWISALRLDGHGQLRTPPADVATGAPAVEPKATGAGVSISGEALVVFTGEPFGRSDALYGRWMDAEGHPLTDVFDTGLSPPWMGTIPLLDRSVVLVSGDARRAFRPGDTMARAAPGWVRRATGTIALLPRSHGYAILLPPGLASEACRRIVELRAPSGKLCGGVAAQSSANRSGSSGYFVDLGLDGTLIQTVQSTKCSFGICCDRFIWPGLLR